MTILRTLLAERRSVENPLLPLTSNALVSVLGGEATKSGISVNTSTAPGKYIALYRAITLIAGAIAGLAFEAHRIGPARERFRSVLLERPHPEMTRMEVWEWLLCSLLSAGHAFAFKEYDANDRVVVLDPIAPARVKLRKVERTIDNPAGREFDILREDGQRKTFTRRQILHIPGPMGLSPIGVAAQSIGSSLAAEEYTGRLWGSGSLMSGVLQTEQRLDEQQALALKQRWQAKIAGLAHAHEVAVLDSGAKYQPISFSPADAQLIESKKFGVTEIARLYGIPPHMLAEQEKSTSWGTGIEQQAIGFVVFTLRPWLIRVEQRISDECLPRGVEAHFHTDALTLGDAKTRAEADQIDLANGVKSFNEVRIDRGLPPRDGGDEYMIPLNMRPLSQGDSLKDRVDAAGALVRAGYDPIDSLLLVGLDPIRHLGYLPVTLQSDDEPADEDVEPRSVINVHPPSVHVPEPRAT